VIRVNKRPRVEESVEAGVPYQSIETGPQNALPSEGLARGNSVPVDRVTSNTDISVTDNYSSENEEDDSDDSDDSDASITVINELSSNDEDAERPTDEFGSLILRGQRVEYALRNLNYPSKFRDTYRMEPSIFRSLYSWCRKRSNLCATGSMSRAEKLFIFLQVVGSGLSVELAELFWCNSRTRIRQYV